MDDREKGTRKKMITNWNGGRGARYCVARKEINTMGISEMKISEMTVLHDKYTMCGKEMEDYA